MKKSVVILTLISLSLFSCDKLCKKTTQDLVKLQNTTGRALTLSVCKGRVYGETTLEVPADNKINQLSLGSRQTNSVAGGTDSCKSGDDKVLMGISLAQTSYAQVKLCTDSIGSQYVVTELSQSCPDGLDEQTSTGPCPTTIEPVTQGEQTGSK